MFVGCGLWVVGGSEQPDVGNDLRKQENGKRPPHFLGKFLDSRVSPPKLLSKFLTLGLVGDLQTSRAERPHFLETRANNPQFLLKFTKFDPSNS